MKELLQEFRDPPEEYRGKPFWAWNGKLEAEELRRQIRVMKRMGLGGFFMHSRVGLATPYLSDEWFEMVKACVDEARKEGMEAWLYDEDRWPSGAAGGLVTKEEKYRQKRLVMVVCEPREADFAEQPLAVFSARIEGDVALDVERIAEGASWKKIAEGKKLLAFFVRTAETSPWFNGAAYLDTMSREAVARFIEVTHEAYRREVGDAFGSTVPGIFTDEPCHAVILGESSYGGFEARTAPWTERLAEIYSERYGESLLPHLPEIFYRVEGRDISPARYRYHDCKTYAFVDAFARQIGEWCQKNNIRHTGHVMAEATLRGQASLTGSPMRFYEHMQAPGIDILTEQGYEYDTAKQCSSVAHQMGRRWMLSELYGCTGWQFGFEAHKAIGDWQAALGVNLRCQHLSWYTMAGQAKRDYPASIHFHSPWWQHYRKVEDYFARVGVLMSRGEPVRKLLVIHPIESVWARATVNWQQDEDIDRLETQFDELRQWLLEEHVDFDYGDEEMLSRLGGVVSGEEPSLRVGKADYEAVLVPPLLTCRSSTLGMLREFAEAGGLVVFCGELPHYVDAVEPQGDELAFAEACETVPYSKEDVVGAVAAARVLSIADADGREKGCVLYQLRRDAEDLYLFMCNTDRENATGPLSVTVEAEGRVQLWDAESGERFAIEAHAEGEKLRFETEMAPSGSRLFLITPKAEELPAAPRLDVTRSLELPDGWTSELTEPNVLVLDFARYRVDDGPWKGPLEVLKVDNDVRAAVGLRERGGSMVQPWARPKVEGPSCGLELSFAFEAAQLPEGAIWLAMEDPGRFAIELNGRDIPTDAQCGWWVDPAIRLLPLDVAALRSGKNELLLKGRFDEDANLEAMFILGDFSVEVSGDRARIVGGTPQVKFGDWTRQGLPFYGGSVVFRKNLRIEPEGGERVFVEVPQFKGACVRVLVGGREAGIIGWEPHELDITEFVGGEAEVELAVEVVSHRRNTFGPLHLVDPKPRWTGSGQFVTTGDEWRDAYHLVACGLLSAPRLSYRRPQ